MTSGSEFCNGERSTQPLTALPPPPPPKLLSTMSLDPMVQDWTPGVLHGNQAMATPLRHHFERMQDEQRLGIEPSTKGAQ